MKVLSHKPAWAWAVVHAGKAIENRSWSTKYRGPLYIHASTDMARSRDYSDRIEQISGLVVPELLWVGAVIGVVDLADVLAPGERIPEGIDRRWSMPDQFHWVYRNPRPLEPIAAVGKLRLWDLEK